MYWSKWVDVLRPVSNWGHLHGKNDCNLSSPAPFAASYELQGGAGDLFYPEPPRVNLWELTHYSYWVGGGADYHIDW